MNQSPRALSRFVRFALFGALMAVVSACFGVRTASAQAVIFDGRTTVFHEPGPKSTMTVFTPSTDLTVNPWDFLTVSAGWEADVVSGASERVKAGPLWGSRFGPDVVSSASVHDTRHSGRGSFTLRKELTQLTVGGNTSTENDYKSNSLNVSARTDLFEHDTQLEISYARNWDRVCDLAHTFNADFTSRQPLDSSTGCFTNDVNRAEDPIKTDAFQGTWSQAWTPEFATQLVYTGQLQNGFLGDPYRAVVLSIGGQIAQEHHPENRTRQALALRGAYFFRPLKGVARLGFRAYRDTWGIVSETAELELEKYLSGWLRLRARGRIYNQSGALFWSDDYTTGRKSDDDPLGSRGQYWSGDRELSPFSSYLVGIRALGSWRAEEKRMLGIFQGLEAAVALDVLFNNYRNFTLAGLPVQDTKAYIGSLSLSALF